MLAPMMQFAQNKKKRAANVFCSTPSFYCCTVYSVGVSSAVSVPKPFVPTKAAARPQNITKAIDPRKVRAE